MAADAHLVTQHKPASQNQMQATRENEALKNEIAEVELRKQQAIDVLLGAAPQE